MLVNRRLSVFCQLRPYRLKKNGGLAFRVMANGAKEQTLQPTCVTPKHRRHCLRNRISFHWKTNYNQLAVKMNQSEDVLIRCWLENHWLCLWKCPPCKSINCIHWFLWNFFQFSLCCPLLRLNSARGSERTQLVSGPNTNFETRCWQFDNYRSPVLRWFTEFWLLSAVRRLPLAHLVVHLT